MKSSNANFCTAFFTARSPNYTLRSTENKFGWKFTTAAFQTTQTALTAGKFVWEMYRDKVALQLLKIDFEPIVITDAAKFQRKDRQNQRNRLKSHLLNILTMLSQKVLS